MGTHYHSGMAEELHRLIQIISHTIKHNHLVLRTLDRTLQSSKHFRFIPNTSTRLSLPGRVNHKIALIHRCSLHTKRLARQHQAFARGSDPHARCWHQQRIRAVVNHTRDVAAILHVWLVLDDTALRNTKLVQERLFPRASPRQDLHLRVSVQVWFEHHNFLQSFEHEMEVHVSVLLDRRGKQLVVLGLSCCDRHGRLRVVPLPVLILLMIYSSSVVKHQSTATLHVSVRDRRHERTARAVKR
mmetsp:Transcript_5074/g.12767  ORF Transcript_5074/g.12767 Transcript_5074/m.12767 type:complete len:243 (-) Transcript_5074:341-1069(-)